jgi:glycosyltransferase involved in cell wall biosynthesis
MEQRALACAGITASRVRYIPNGIDQDFWRAGPAVATDAPPTVVFVGRLLPVKGVDVLLTAFARLRERLPAAQLCLIGEGELRGTLEARVAELGIADGVSFAGQLAPPAVRERLARASLFVLPSRSEGLPMALLEAMAAGLPAVASAVGGIPEVLTPDCGRLVPPEDPAALAEALMALLQAPGRQAMGEAARQRAAAFSSSAADASYERLFLELRAGVL